MAQLNPYLHFGGNCREAMEFYKASLGGDLNIQTIGDSPYASPETKDNVLHSELKLGNFTLMASDMMEEGDVESGNRYGLCLVCASKSEIQRLFANLSAGGQVTHPLKEEFFGTYGDLLDKYGISWMFQLGPNAPD